MIYKKYLTFGYSLRMILFIKEINQLIYLVKA